MKAIHEIIAMREAAFAKSLEADDRRRLGLAEPDAADRNRAFAQGVEAGLLWAMGHAGSPFSD